MYFQNVILLSISTHTEAKCQQGRISVLCKIDAPVVLLPKLLLNLSFPSQLHWMDIMDCACTKGLSSTNESAQGVWSPRSRELVPHFLHFLIIQNHFPLCFHPLPKIRPASAKAQMLPFFSAVFSENFTFYP